MSHLSVKSIWN